MATGASRGGSVVVPLLIGAAHAAEELPVGDSGDRGKWAMKRFMFSPLAVVGLSALIVALGVWEGQPDAATVSYVLSGASGA